MVYLAIAWLLALVGLALSVWVVLPAPVAALLVLAVGAPEVSLWLVLLNSVSLAVSGFGLRRYGAGYALLACGVVALVLSLVPLMQFAAANQAAQQAMQQGLGPNFEADLPVMVQLRSHPLSLLDGFRGIPTGTVRYTSAIPVANPDGVPLTLDVYQPPKQGTYPGIVMIHGGGWRSGSPKDNAAFARYMAARGYVVWAIAYRLAPQFHFPAQLDDVQTALTFVRQHAQKYETDPQRLALMGRSAGAQLAMVAGYQASDPSIRAVVNYYGPINLLNGYYDLPRPDPLNVRHVLEGFLGGTPEVVGDRYEAASPSQYVTPKLPPTLLIYGTKDHIVLPKFGQAMAQRLRSQGNPTVYIEIPWADHAFDAVFNGVSNQFALYYTERFLAWTLHVK